MSNDPRAKVQHYGKQLLECGGNDPLRLVVCGLVYLPRDAEEKSIDILTKSGLDIWVYIVTNG